MIILGENIHIISKKVHCALEEKDENFVKNLIKIQQNCDGMDFNIGPAKGKLDNIFEWLCSYANGASISFDSSNISAIERGLKIVPNPQNCFINSTSGDIEKLERLTDLAIEHNCNLIALAMSKGTGIPKTADGRLELVFGIYEKCLEKGISSDKIFFDPLVLPVKADQSQAIEALNTIKMIKESFDPPVKTIIGLSNISNGMANELRALVNRVYGVLAFGAGLDSVIMDAKDCELIRIFEMLENSSPHSEIDNLYINLVNMVQCFGELEDIKFNKMDSEQLKIIKTAEILLNKKIYSDSFAQV
ncbi:dihydropteroate synthase [bacterium]|nr:dihydropteroate synthase [bacterium]